MRNDQFIDCHAHIVDPVRFPYENGPGYKPTADEAGTQEAYVADLDQARIRHALLVQPSCYGFDNSALLDTMRRFPGRFKSIAMVSSTVSDEELLSLGEAGVVGVRFNLVSYDPDAFKHGGTIELLHRVKALDWFVEVVADDAQWEHASTVLQTSGVKVLVDHFGMHAMPSDVDQPGFRAVLQLGRNPKAVVKLTTPYSLGLSCSKHGSVEPFVDLLLEVYGVERCVWGSDWPFLTVVDPPDLTQAMAYLERWVTDPDDRQRILWQNPSRLFGFSGSPNG